ncbi:hypothetical protein ACGFIF_25245 [Kribbella sp. NPDC049174]|uniref:hypothetical protein n=1 Tax=Kribbella sp. NPDC049174 TaxID=3364112 RepID=UPI003714D0B9
MSTPHQGPGQWEPGNWVAATDYLANLNAQQQQNLQLVLNMNQEQAQKLERMLNKQPLRARIHTAIGNAVARVHEVYDQTAERLSEAAQTLATQARQYRQAAVDTYNQASGQVADLVDRGVVAADLAAQRAREGINAGGRAVAQGAQATGQAVVQGAQVTGQAVAQSAQVTGQAIARGAQATGQAVVQGAQATGQAIAQGAQVAGQAIGRGAQATGRAVAEGGRQAVAAGQQLAGNVSRWFQDKKAHAQIRGEAARASFAAFRMDPTLPREVASPQERLELSQQFSKVLAATTPEARLAAVKELLQTTQAQVGAKENAQNMSVALGGVAPASRATGPGQVVGTDQGTEQGAQSTVNLTKNPPTKGGPSLGG